MSEVPLYSSFVSRTVFHGERKLPVLWVGYSARDSDVSGNSNVWSRDRPRGDAVTGKYRDRRILTGLPAGGCRVPPAGTDRASHHTTRAS